MSRRPPRNHSPAFKSKVALGAIRGEKMLAELAEQFDVHANKITSWPTQLLEGAAEVFGGRRGFALDAERWKAFVSALDAPVRDMPHVRKLLNEPGIFSGYEPA